MIILRTAIMTCSLLALSPTSVLSDARTTAPVQDLVTTSFTATLASSSRRARFEAKAIPTNEAQKAQDTAHN